MNQTTNFDDLFLKKDINTLLLNWLSVPPRPGKQSPPWGNYSSNEVPTLSVALQFVRDEFIKSKQPFPELYFRINWIDFQKLDCVFDTTIIIKFRFSKFEFEVFYNIEESSDEPKPNSLKNIFKSHYKTEYDHAQIHEINHQLANKVYDFIAAKLAEADTPPA